MKFRPIYFTLHDEKGKVIKRIPMTAADDDWIRAARLKKRADTGDQEAAEQLKQMEDSQMGEWVEDIVVDEPE